jgi:hypothetical protein
MASIPVIGRRAALFHAPQPNKDFEYRTGTGMMGSAEWAVFMDDFLLSFIPSTAITNGPVANTPWGWQGAVIDTGATVAVNTTATLGANGVVTLADATASEGAAFYGQKTVQLTAGKKFWMEARIRTDDVTDNTVQFGLSALTATTNPEDLWTTTATDVWSFGILDGSASVSMLADKSNSGSTAETGTRSMEADTWHILALSYDGVTIKGYLDGREALSWSQAASTIPTGVALAPFVGHINGNGAGGNVVVVDYVRIVSER